MTKTSNWRLRALPDLSRPLAYISTIDFSNPSLRDAHPPPQISKARVAADRIRHRLVFIKKNRLLRCIHSLKLALLLTGRVVSRRATVAGGFRLGRFP
jgi:hypothetical protein